MNFENKANSGKGKSQKTFPVKETNTRIYRNEKPMEKDESNDSKIIEKEFYENFKPLIENSSNKNFEKILIDSLKTIVQRKISAYQLFKILQSSKVKPKFQNLKEKEQDFYVLFWEMMDFQKASVKIEGLKLLGYLTSEYLQVMSQDTQIRNFNQLKALSSLKSQARNLNVIRFAFNCVGNILTNTTFKVLDENQEIFYNIFDFIKEINSPQKLQDPNNTRVLVAAMRVLGCLYIDLKLYTSNITEFLLSQLMRYVYLGTSFFPLPKTNFSLQGEISSDSIITSSSEISDADDSIESKKEDETCSKIRNYSAVCLANIFRHNPKIISQYFSTLLPCKVLRKEVTKFIEHAEKPMVLDSEFLEKRKRKTTYLIEFRNDFNEPTLLHLLLFEENSKVKISVCKVIAAILDGYQGDKLLLTIDGEKLEKTKIEPYKSISHQIYQIFKNLTLAVTIAILLETDESTLNHLLRLAPVMISHPSYEKVGHLTIRTFIKNILFKLIPNYHYHTLYLSCISCFGAFASGNIRHKEFDKLAFSPSFNIIEILLQNIQEALKMNKDPQPPKSEKIPDSTILLESLIVLSKFPKHFVEHLLVYEQLIITILEKIQNLDKKYINLSFKIIEEIIKYVNESKGSFDNADLDGDENTEKNKPLTQEPGPTIQIQNFHGFISKFINEKFTPANENIEHILDILYYLEESDWEQYYTEIKDKFISSFSSINSTQSLKQSFLRLLGKVCIFPSFMNIKDFPKFVYKVVLENYNEKNNNIMIKNSWVLANLCANFTHFELFSIEENQKILLMSLGYCNSNKEKLISNGFRALGFYIKNNNDELLCKTIEGKDLEAENIKKALSEVYKKPFSKCSVKVCWNVCVSFSNILKSFQPKFMQLFFNESILYNIAEILTTKNNFKTQMHCIDMLSLAYKKFPQSQCFPELLQTLVLIYFASEEGNFNPSEVRYLPNLKNDISELFVKLLKDLDFETNSKYIVQILSSIPHKICKLIYETLERSYRNNREKLFEEKWRGDEENHSPTITPTDNLLNFDEVMVKGKTSHQKIAIPVSTLSKPELQSFYSCLFDLKYICQKCTSLIDSSEDLTVSFSIYNGLKQLGDLNLDSKEDQIILELEHV